MSTRRPNEVEPGWIWDQVSNLDYVHAAHVLGLPVGWLKEKASADDLPRGFYGKHVRFTPDDIREIRRIYSWAANAPVVAVLGDNEADRAKIRAALQRQQAA